MDATDVKDALRAAHPAVVEGKPGPWTCVEEVFEIDLLAFAATAYPRPGLPISYPIIGFEVKVSRGDLLAELANPAKRAYARSHCHLFYLATPVGLVREGELPADVGLWECDESGEGWIAVPSPVVAGPAPLTDMHALGTLIRWVSVKPDPRHWALGTHNPYVLG